MLESVADISVEPTGGWFLGIDIQDSDRTGTRDAGQSGDAANTVLAPKCILSIPADDTLQQTTSDVSKA